MKLGFGFYKHTQNQYSALVEFSLIGILAALPIAGHAQGTGLTEITTPVVYSDGRPYPSYRMDATDLGKFLDYGGAANQTDYLGIREALINQVDGTYYLFYDGAGPNGWLAHLAESTDLVTWDLRGPGPRFRRSRQR